MKAAPRKMVEWRNSIEMNYARIGAWRKYTRH